jgi:glycosyltransferase involved in cell wall biosynthesis
LAVTEETTRPFFSIGVTTYNRHELLRETLNSILAQSFTDFEVIVGNDYTQEVLTGEMLGITDPRIRFVNHPRNLREVGNMNALLEMAKGGSSCACG